MIGEATTVGLSPTGIDGDNFDVFSSLRGGAESDNFSSGIDDIGEEATAGVDEAAGKLDLMAVAGGKAELDTFMDDSTDLEDMPALVDALSLASKSEINSPENRMSDERKETICQGVASAACASCAASGTCSILRMINFADENLQPAPERESYLSELLNNNDDSIVVAGYVNSNDGEVNTISTEATKVSEDRVDESNEQMVSQEQERKALTNETVESLGDDIGAEAAEVSNYSKKIEMHIVDAVSDAVHDYSKQSTPIVIEADPVVPIVEDAKKVNDDFADMVVGDVQASPQIEVKEPKLVEAVDTADSLSPVSPVEAPSRETPSHNTTADDTGDYNNSHDMVSEVEEKSALPAIEQELSAQAPEPSVDIQTEDVKRETPAKEIITAASIPVKKQSDQPAAVPSPIQNSVEHGEEMIFVNEESAVDDAPPQPAIVDTPAVYEAVKVVPGDDAVTEREVIDVKPPVATAGNEDELQTELPQDSNQEAAVDQTIYETQLSPVEQRDDVVVEERSCGDDEVWAEEDVVFFVEQPSAVEQEVPLVEAVAVELVVRETTVASQEIDEPETFVADEGKIEDKPVELLDDFQAVSVVEVIKDTYEPVPNIELREAPERALEEYGLPREKQNSVAVKPAAESDAWRSDDDIKAAAIEISDITSDVDPAKEMKEIASPDAMVAFVEAEPDEQVELAVYDMVEEYDYVSEVSTVDDVFLFVKNHPLSGLWVDDSPLNSEEGVVTTTQSAADDSSLVSRLVGVLVVAMCVARGKHTKVLFSG